MNKVWTENTIDNDEERREKAYKVVLIVSLCISILSCTCMCTVFPLLYQYMSLSGTQFGNVLDFCEYTAESVLFDTGELLENSSRLPVIVHMNQTRFERQANGQQTRCSCEAKPGLIGLPGRKGQRGQAGRPGSAGLPARLPCEPLQDLKKYCPEKCPAGLQGAIGQRGTVGDKGGRGEKGKPGKDGEDGKLGNRGQPGVSGVGGANGEDGDAGIDMTPTPFVTGPAGPMGEVGNAGLIGPPGMPGIDGPIGPRGKKGLSGLNGLSGMRGSTGPIGLIGDQGKPGQPGVCPTYCATDGGVFFVEPPAEWFSNDNN